MYKMEGIIPAMITPFNQNYSLNEKGFREVLRFLINKKVHCILVGGSTGEYTLMEKEERKRIIELAVEEANGEVPIMAGTAYQSTEQTIELTKFAAEAGADSALIITPHYPKPAEEGLKNHYRKIAENVDIPIIIYHWPGGTGVTISPEDVLELSELKNLAGIKNTAPQEHTNELIQLTKDCADFNVVTGWETLLLPTISCGGTGGIGVAHNVVPEQMIKIYDLSNAGKVEEARYIHNQLLPLYKLLFKEPSPGPIKAALELLGLPAGPSRLPILPVANSLRKELQEELTKLGVI